MRRQQDSGPKKRKKKEKEGSCSISLSCQIMVAEEENGAFDAFHTRTHEESGRHHQLHVCVSSIL